MTYAGTMVISYGWLSKSSICHNDNISISLQWRHMNVITSQTHGNSTVCHSVNARDQKTHTGQDSFRLQCMLEWSLSHHSMFALIIPRKHQRVDYRNLECLKFSTSSICLTGPIQVSHQHGSLSIIFVSFKWYLDINKAVWCWRSDSS